MAAMDGEGGDELVLKLQRDSGDLIGNFQSLLPRFLWRSPGNVRRLVRDSKAEQLKNFLEPFQEDPQLLDPHLAKVAASLVDAFLAFLQKYTHEYYSIVGRPPSADVVPLARAICRVIYTLCKVRGPKIITQLLSARPQQLEPMLDAFESWTRETSNHGPDGDMVWEERYVMLLWTSHLSQVPFNLASLTSNSGIKLLDNRGLFPELPDECPFIAARLIAGACRYLGVASKEREAAVKLLTGLALLEDLQRLDIHHILLSWASSELRLSHDRVDARTEYNFLGWLSFIAHFVSSAPTITLYPLSNEILGVAQWTEALESSSAMVTKSLIKLYGGLALHCSNRLDLETEALEIAINFLIENLAADETGVRLAASKGLAKLASRLNPEWATQIVDTILESLQEDVISRDSSLDEESLSDPRVPSAPQSIHKYGDLTYVNARKWHGLILTVSYFILQRSIPALELLRPIQKLIQALNFIQKNTLGYSIGANVRDAACLGLWALARKYNTIDISSASDNQAHLFQILANELVVAALLDPAGNIRRGAAAALQEMVGRHNDTIECGNGLALLQYVDYHAVASRKIAMEIISVRVMAISKQYWECLLHGLLSWRGVGFDDNDSRRKSAAETRECAAKALSSFATASPSDRTHLKIMYLLRHKFQELAISQMSDRHGLLWTFTRVLERMHDAEHSQSATEGNVTKGMLMTQLPEEDFTFLWRMLDLDIVRSPVQLGTKEQRNSRQSPLIFEASAALIRQLCQSTLCNKSVHYLCRVPSPSMEDLEAIFNTITGIRMTQIERTNANINASAIEAVLQVWLRIKPEMPGFSSQSQEDLKGSIAYRFVDRCFDELARFRGVQRYGALAALAKVIFLVGPVAPKDLRMSEGTLSPVQEQIIALLVRETMEGNHIDLREFSLLLLCEFLESNLCTRAMLNAFGACLDDHTMDKQKGDMGSHMRIAATKAVDLLVSKHLADGLMQKGECIAKVCGLAVEKLDKVRDSAFSCLDHNWTACGLASVAKPLAASKELGAAAITYFEAILSLSSFGWLEEAILKGFVTTAGGEYESQIYASRMALVNHTANLSQSDLQIFCNAFINIIQSQRANERLLVPTMEVLAFLFEAGITKRIESEAIKWDILLDLIRKAHAKSKNLRKLEVAIRIYFGLVEVERVKTSALVELSKFLKHPYPRIRNAAADSLVLATGPSPDLVDVDWGRSVKENATHVASIRARLGIEPQSAKSPPVLT